MDAELRELYQQVILDHHRKPRNFGELDGPHRSAEGYNPLCGDRIQVHLAVDEDDRITHVNFTGEGCAICTASASMMTEIVLSKTLDEAKALFNGFRELVTSGEGADDDTLGKLTIFAGVREFPMRVKCATLPWHTLTAAVEDRGAPISTE